MKTPPLGPTLLLLVILLVRQAQCCYNSINSCGYSGACMKYACNTLISGSTAGLTETGTGGVRTTTSGYDGADSDESDSGGSNPSGTVAGVVVTLLILAGIGYCIKKKNE